MKDSGVCGELRSRFLAGSRPGMTTIAVSSPSRFRPEAVFFGGLLGGGYAPESPKFLHSKYWTLAFQFLILLCATNCLMAQDSPTNAQNSAVTRIATIRRITLLKNRKYVEFEINVSQPVDPKAQVLNGPDRLVIDFPNAIPWSELHNLPVDQGEVVDLRVGLFDKTPPVTRIVLDLKKPQGFQILPSGNGVIVRVGSEIVDNAVSAAAPAVNQPTPTQATSNLSESTQSGVTTITGVIRSGNVPIPGATITAINAANGQKAVVWTASDGNYAIQVPTPGHYTIRVEMTAFAPATCEVDAKDSNIRADIALALVSRGEEVAETAQGQTTMAAGNRGFQGLPVMEEEAGGDLGSAGAGEGIVAPEISIPGLDQDSATESVSYSGNNKGSFLISSDELQQRMQEARDQRSGLESNYPAQGPPGGLSGAIEEQTAGSGPTALAPRGRSGAGGVDGLGGGAKMIGLGG